MRYARAEMTLDNDVERTLDDFFTRLEPILRSTDRLVNVSIEVNIGQGHNVDIKSAKAARY